MIWKTLLCAGITLLAGCGGGTAAKSTNDVLNPPADDKVKIEAILKQYGITKTISAVRDNGEYWHVAMADPPPQNTGSDGSPKIAASAGPPDEYKVFKDGRVVHAFDDKPLTKK